MHNVETMMYNQKNGLPWHKLGNSVEGLATSKEALEASGLDWKVKTQRLFTPTNENLDNMSEVSMGKVVVRQSDNKPLGVVGNRYTPLQNTEAFQFFDNIVGNDMAIYETAGSLKGGRVVWLLAKMPDFIRIEGTDDIIEKYVLLTNSHDGSKPVIAKITPVRVVCNNTLSFALRRSGTEVRIRHTKNVASMLDEAKETLGIINRVYEEVNGIFNGMSSLKMNGEDMDEYFNLVFNNGEKEVSTRTENMILDVKQLLEEGAGTDDPAIRGTGWHAYNAITEYVDHYKNYQDRTDKLHALAFGSGAKTKEKAFKVMVDVMK